VKSCRCGARWCAGILETGSELANFLLRFSDTRSVCRVPDRHYPGRLRDGVACGARAHAILAKYSSEERVLAFRFSFQRDRLPGVPFVNGFLTLLVMASWLAWDWLRRPVVSRAGV